MNLKYISKTAIIGLTTNRSRSLLTILGIVIGIMSIMIMVSIGRGAEGLILNEISGLGAETIVLRPGREPTGLTDISETLFSDSLKERDLIVLKKKSNVPDIAAVMPAVVVTGSVSYRGESYTRPTIMGGSAEFFADAFKARVSDGVLFNESDIARKASVAVIGKDIKEELYGEESAIGKIITIKDRKFRIVGIFEDRGQVAFFDINKVVMIPYTTAQTYLLGISHFHEIILKASGPEAVPRTVKDIERTLRETHNIDDPEKDDFYITTQQGLVEQIKTIIGALTTFLSSVVAIALVVGGVGVMNIMLVSVTERTREIGLRKSLGATNKDILLQFLLEAMLLTGAGGVIGITLGTMFSLFASVILTYYVGLNFEFSFPFVAAILGLISSTLVGLVFGLVPARKASKKSPIEALRYE
jgi:putative ABC transport system permease protein